MTMHEKLYNYYFQLLSREMQDEVKSWKPMKMKNVKVAIRVDFKKDWIKVYQLESGEVEWY